MATLLSCLSRSADRPDVFSAIREEGCNLAIWQRAPFADFAPLADGDPQNLRFTCNPEALPGQLAEGLVQGGYGGDAALHRALIDDAANLARRYAAVMELSRIEVRLEVVRTDSCRKFHADYVTARLITTYVGQGTDWLDEHEAARVAAGGAPHLINRLAAFDVGLFKGKLATSRPAIHRSPPIAGTGAARLLLVFDPARKALVDRDESSLSSPHHLS